MKNIKYKSFKDCKTVKQKISYILSVVITVLLIFILLVGLVGGWLYLLQGKGSASVHAESTSTTVVYTTGSYSFIQDNEFCTFNLDIPIDGVGSSIPTTGYIDGTMGGYFSYAGGSANRYTAFYLLNPYLDSVGEKFLFEETLIDFHAVYFIFRGVNHIYAYDNGTPYYMYGTTTPALFTFEYFEGDLTLTEYDNTQHGIPYGYYLHLSWFWSGYTTPNGLQPCLELFFPVDYMLDDEFNYSVNLITDNETLQAYDAGYNAGYFEGVAYGEYRSYNEGYTDGYMVGEESGYTSGYNVGYNEGLNVQWGDIDAFAAIKHGVDSLLEIKLFGVVSIATLFTIAFGFLLISLLLKFIMGG